MLCLLPLQVQAESIQFYGDVLLSRGVARMINYEGIDAPWTGVRTLLDSGAVNIANLEGATGSASSCVQGHNPCFFINPSNLRALAPFDVLGLENNHSLDLGTNGMEAGLRSLKKMGIVPLGGRDYFTILRTDDGNMGIIALTDVVNAPGDRKFMPEPDSAKVFHTIRWLKERCTLVAVFMHWGRELDDLPTNRMKKLASMFVKAGADIIVGAHPHVVGGVECIGHVPVVYSLGNFLFDQKYEETKQGAVLRCSIDKDGRLACKLIAVSTPMNSFKPYVLPDADVYSRENILLASCRHTLTKTWTGVFTEHGKESRLVLAQKHGAPEFSRIELSDISTGHVIFRSPYMPIVRLQTVDLSGNGIDKVMLIEKVYSSIDNKIDKRVYLYSIGFGLRALWRGSALSRPLLDAVFIRQDGGKKPVLFALHRASSFLLPDRNKNGRIVTTYRWNGFGFTGISEKVLHVPANRITLIGRKIKFLTTP